MKILGIDTSSKFLNIALSEDEDIIKEESHLLDRRHASQLVPKVKELLKKYRTPISKIDVFIIGLGPGSFTGLRIGVSTIKGFGIASGKPCIGVASIDSIACNAQENNKDIIPIIDAKRGQVYAAIYKRKGNKVARLSDYLVLPIEKLMEKIKRDSVFLGDGLSLYGDKIANYINPDSYDMGKFSTSPFGDFVISPYSSGSAENLLKSLPEGQIFLEEEYWYPGAGNLIKLGFSKIKKTKNTNLAKLTPLYLYPEDCQVR